MKKKTPCALPRPPLRLPQPHASLRSGPPRRSRQRSRHSALRLLRHADLAALPALPAGLRRHAPTPSATPSKRTRRSPSFVSSDVRARASTSSPAASSSASAAPIKPALKKVVFSGVGKQAWEIDAALKADILQFNVESEQELDLLAERAKHLAIRARFALRVNPDVFAETHPYISTGLSEHKFGIAITSARAIYRRAAKSKWLEPYGVSVHIGSQIRKVDPFAAALERVTSLVAELRRDGHDIRTIDAGGGLGIDYSDAPFDAPHQVERYAAALNNGLADETAHLLLEPGRFLVAQAGALLTRVLVVKKNGTKTFIITDAAMNDLIRPALYHAHHEIVPVRSPKANPPSPPTSSAPSASPATSSPATAPSPTVKPGDLVALLDAGAYGMSLSPPTTTPAPAPPRSSSKATKSPSPAAAKPCATSSPPNFYRYPPSLRTNNDVIPSAIEEPLILLGAAPPPMERATFASTLPPSR